MESNSSQLQGLYGKISELWQQKSDSNDKMKEFVDLSMKKEVQ